MRLLILLLVVLFSGNQCTTSETILGEQLTDTEMPKRMYGLSFTAPSAPFPENPMPKIQAVNADWIAALPFGYTRQGDPTVAFNLEWQWWGECTAGINETVRLAHAAGLKVMMKPQVYMPGSWVGYLDFEQEADWEAWEADYRNFILHFSEIAENQKVAMVCVGTEFEIGAIKREKFWRGLIKEIRGIYSGKLTYAANWDGYAKVPFWDALDIVGINAYFPLIDAKTPAIGPLKAAWRQPLNEMSQFYTKIKKPILFTEYGYLSVDGCAHKNWELEDQLKVLAINEQAQANALAALYEVFGKQAWWAGGFLWKWFPNGDGHEGYLQKDYTPQDKLAEEVLKEWFGKE